MLLAAGADITAKWKGQKSALDFARDKGKPDIATLILSRKGCLLPINELIVTGYVS